MENNIRIQTVFCCRSCIYLVIKKKSYDSKTNLNKFFKQNNKKNKGTNHSRGRNPIVDFHILFQLHTIADHPESQLLCIHYSNCCCRRRETCRVPPLHFLQWYKTLNKPKDRQKILFAIATKKILQLVIINNQHPLYF